MSVQRVVVVAAVVVAVLGTLGLAGMVAVAAGARMGVAGRSKRPADGGRSGGLGWADLVRRDDVAAGWWVNQKGTP